MSRQEILDQISMLLGQLLAEARGNKEAIAIINNIMIAIGEITDLLA